MPSKHKRVTSPDSESFDLPDYLRAQQTKINSALDTYLPPARRKPATLHRAMRYSIFAGGKRLRPILCLAAAEACGGSDEAAMPLACALECIHTYSLIHDDLPCMDDDDLRRGKPTNHVVFGEAIAVLAGDALLTSAFEIGTKAHGSPRYPHRTLVQEIADASGSLKLIAGQVADLEGEGRKLSIHQLKYIHERKTSALLRCAVRLGGMSANATPAKLRALSDFGSSIGLAFQVIDDILDVTQTSEQLGKTAGKDQAVDKATYPSMVGLERSRKIAGKLTRNARESLSVFNGKAKALEALTDYLIERKS